VKKKKEFYENFFGKSLREEKAKSMADNGVDFFI
jgi:hypothetical protein